MKKKYILPVLLAVQIVALNVIALFPAFVEKYYSNGLYVGFSKFGRLLFGWIPFSAGDIIYAAAIALALRWLWRRRKTFRAEWKDNVLKILSCFCIVYFIFNLFWGLNYHREKLADKLHIGQDYTNAELLAFTKKLIAKTNSIQLKITANDTVKVAFPYSQEQVFEKNQLGYAQLAKTYPGFAYETPSIKKSLISLPLTYMGFAGYLNPFTGEAQVNYKVPMYTFPTTAAHEMAHQIGYASESEANFVGYLASVKNGDLYFEYSGYVTALRYCLGNWEIRDESVLKSLMKTVNPGILKNFKQSNDFWDSYESFIEYGFHIFYDNFLKLNQQEGLESYNRFVDLLVNYYKYEKL